MCSVAPQPPGAQRVELFSTRPFSGIPSGSTTSKATKPGPSSPAGADRRRRRCRGRADHDQQGGPGMAGGAGGGRGAGERDPGPVPAPLRGPRHPGPQLSAAGSGADLPGATGDDRPIVPPPRRGELTPRRGAGGTGGTSVSALVALRAPAALPNVPPVPPTKPPPGDKVGVVYLRLTGCRLTPYAGIAEGVSPAARAMPVWRPALLSGMAQRHPRGVLGYTAE